MNKLAHGGTNGGHFGFSFDEQTLIERLDVRIVTDTDDGSHIQYGTQTRWTGFGKMGSPQD